MAILSLSGYLLHKWGCSADSASQEVMPVQLQATLKELQRRPLESQVFSLADLEMNLFSFLLLWFRAVNK